MIELGVWLVTVGLCDLLRAARDATTAGRRAAMVAIGFVLLLLAAVAIGAPVGRSLLLLVGWLAFLVLWLLGSASAAVGRRRGVARAVAFLGLGGGVLFCVLGADLVGPVTGDLPDVLERVGLERLLLGAGVGLVQLSTANVAVRLVLDAVGVPAATNEKQLKGGRVLGPMERLFIVGLGLAGQVTAASVVVAAKGLLRFPELQRGSSASGPSDVTEYFLIGSFASWLVALSGLGLMQLVQ